MNEWETNEWRITKKIILPNGKIKEVEDLNAEIIKKIAKEEGYQRFIVSTDENAENLLEPNDDFSEIEQVYIFTKEKVA